MTTLQTSHSRNSRQNLSAITALTAAVLSACGGSDSGITLSGMAATGAPMVKANIVITDVTGLAVQQCDNTSTCTAGDDGRFNITLPTTAQAPFVLIATPTDGGRPQVSMTTSSTSTTVNITPISTLIASQLASGDPTTLKSTPFNGNQLAEAKQVILNKLQPLLTAVDSTTDPLTGSLKADGLGLDKALDALHVHVLKTDTGAVEVVGEITLNGDGTQPASIVLKAGAEPTSQGMDRVTKDALPADGLAPLMAQLLQNANTCLNLPYAERVDSSASPVSLKADACKELFYNNDPSTYKNNGSTIGVNKSFSELLENRDNTGPLQTRNVVTFDTPVYDFTRTGTVNGQSVAGDVMMQFHWKTLLGDEGWKRMVVRQQGGKLRLIGNQYAYEARVRPYSQRRTFLETSSTAFSYDATGYNTFVMNQLDAQGRSLFDRVLVTAPTATGKVIFTLKPNAGFDSLGHVKGQTLTTTSVIRLQWAFRGGQQQLNSAGTNLADLETASHFARDATTGAASAWSDEQIKDIAQQGRWKFDFFLAGNTGSTPDTTQWSTTLARAQTLDEARATAWTQLSDKVTQDSSSRINSTWQGIPLAGQVMDLTQPDGAPDWNVQSGAVAPTLVQVIGKYFPNYPTNGSSSLGFNDRRIVASTDRNTVVRCQALAVNDVHCATDGSGNYAAKTFATGLELWGLSRQEVERSMFYAFYKRTP